MSDLMLDFRGVGLTYPGGTTALESVDLQVRRGEFVAVVGPSGCGKSSLLRIASGLGRASEGEAIVDAKRLGYVFQEATLLPWLSVLDNVALFPGSRGRVSRPAGSGRARPWRRSVSTGSRTICRTSSPAACGCGSRWRAR